MYTQYILVHSPKSNFSELCRSGQRCLGPTNFAGSLDTTCLAGDDSIIEKCHWHSSSSPVKLCIITMLFYSLWKKLQTNIASWRSCIQIKLTSKLLTCLNLLFVTGSLFRRPSTKKLELWFVLWRMLLLFWTATGTGAELFRSNPPVNQHKVMDLFEH